MHTFASTCISKMISREDALIGIATHEYKAVWKEGRKLHWRSTPSEKYALLFKNLRRILYIVVHFHPYLHLDILSEVLLLTLSDARDVCCYFYFRITA